MQLQADLVGCPVEVAAEPETTALGAAGLTGLALGVWPDTATVAKLLRRGRRYEPSREQDDVEDLRAGWRLAVRRALLR
jgi:glycerol kinase